MTETVNAGPDLVLDHLSLPDLTALELIDVAAQSGFSGVSLFALPLPLGPYRDLVTDAAARREVVQALRGHELCVGIVEPFMIDPAPDWDTLERLAGLTAELGGTVNALAFDDDASRLADTMAHLAGIARASGTRLTIEAFTLSRVRTPAQALSLAEVCGADVGVTVDCLHVMRTVGSWDAVAALPHERIAHVQLCDGPRSAPPDLGREAIAGRLPPGKGGFDVGALLPLLPASARLAVEAPLAETANRPAAERAAVLMAATRALFAA
jgi:Sugar phosphate isomerases/epimerases